MLKEVLKGIGALRLTSFIEDNSIRTAFLHAVNSPMKDDVHFAILECYGKLMEHQDLTLDDVFGDGPIQGMTDGQREKLRDGIEDALFSDNGCSAGADRGASAEMGCQTLR